MYATPEQRAAVITGLRELADYLEANPEVPTDRGFEMGVAIITSEDFPDDAAKVRETERIAALVGAPVESGHGYHHAHRAFGPVSYRATAIDQVRMAAYYALHSYDGSVVPDAA